MNLLIVDDQKDIRYLLARLVENKGWDSVEAGSGEEALEADLESLDAVILDYSMPGVDGLQVASEYRDRGWEKPIIVYSGYLSAEVEGRFIDLGAVCFEKSEFRLLVNHLEELSQAAGI